MRILIIGATGTIGSAVSAALGPDHDIIHASRSSDITVDIENLESIKAMYAAVGQVDAVVSCAGHARFGPLPELSDEDFSYSIGSKLMGQVNVVRYGLDSVRDNGSITLTAGDFSQRPWPGASANALINGALESFARAAALDVPRGIRVNVVSPPFIDTTAAAMGMADKGELSAAENARAYVSMVEGEMNGAVAYPILDANG